MTDSHIELQRPAHASDASSFDRPGVPQEDAPPRPLANAHWLEPEQQQSAEPPIVGAGRQLTPVFSVANPPRGLSGLLRRAAYRAPDYRPKRWMLLVLADRIDVIEHNPKQLLKAVAVTGVVTACIVAAFQRRARS